MKKLLLILILAANSFCAAKEKEVLVIRGEVFEPVYARITYYYPGEDKWGWKNACPNTPKSKEGVTIAAHPDFKFGTKVFIPNIQNHLDGNNKFFIVQDRGTAVTKKLASKGDIYVFDVFVSCRQKYKKIIKLMPAYAKIYVKTS